MAADWRSVTVQQLVDEGILDRPMDGNHGEIHPKARDFVDHGIPFIMASDLDGGRVDMDRCAFISEVQARTLRKGFARSGDVLISHKATMGRTALVEELDVPFLMLTPQVTYYRVRNPSLLDHRYLKFYFDSPTFQTLFETWGQKGSTRAYIGITAQLDLPIVLPPIDEQRAIARILGTLDDKIELNRRMNETLEAMARALFKSWFVDFDPVRAKAEGRDPGLPKPLADLFPDRLEVTDSYTAPAGWRGLRWGELVTLEYGKSLEGYAGEEKPFPVYGTNGRIGSCARPLCENAGIIIGRKGAYRGVHWCSEPFFVIDTAFFVAAKAPIELRWAYYELLRRDINSMDSGSAIPSTSRADFYGLNVLTPPIKIQRAFVRLLSPCWARQDQTAVESRTLAALRDTLLPKLISGELLIKPRRPNL